MAYRLRLDLHNPGTQPRRTVIHGGTVFEVVDPFSATQNLVATKDTEISIPAGSSQAIEIDVWCMNPTLREPADTPMRLTALATNIRYETQEKLWVDMRSRR